MLLCCWMSDDDRFELLRLIQQSGIEPVVGREDDRRCTSASVLRQKKNLLIRGVSYYSVAIFLLYGGEGEKKVVYSVSECDGSKAVRRV